MKLSSLTRFNNVFSGEAKGRFLYQIWLYFDCIRCKMLYGFSPENYVAYRVWNLNHFTRKNILAGRNKDRVEKLFNTGKDTSVIGDKEKFNQFFKVYVQRDWIYTKGKTESDIREFLQRNPVVMVKELRLSQGKGLYKLVSADADDADVRELARKNLLLEEFVEQHPAMAKLNPSSVNTCRIITVKDSAGDTHIIAAGLRVGGKDAAVDNLHGGGAMYTLDLDLGMVTRGGVSSEGKRNILLHPSTGHPMPGFVVPNWEHICATVKKAAALLDEFRFVGWDVAVTQRGCELIEANILTGTTVYSNYDRPDFYDIVMRYK